VQFLLIGGLVFAVVQWKDPAESASVAPPGLASAGSKPRAPVGSGGGPSQTIVVDRASLLSFVQIRTQSVDAAAAARAFDALEAPGQRDWLERFVREEALVREARRLGLDQEDDLIRRRLVQKMEFLAEDMVGDPSSVSRAELEAAYRDRSASFGEPALVDFTHVFVRSPGVPADPESDPLSRARLVLEQLTRGGIQPDRAAPFGDRFLYHRRYRDRTLDEVRSHFGARFAEALAVLEIDPDRWQGPLRSDHGWHLVWLRDRVEDRVPTFAELEATLERELNRGRSEARAARALDAIVSGYEVELQPDLEIRGP
jgi:hypothetical protein